MQEKKLSIITINLNNNSGLEKTIESVVSEIYDNVNVEFLIIDGKSQDFPLDLISRNKRYIDAVISEEDSGIYNAMNKGIDLSNGDWVIFMNSGDLFVRGAVLNILNLIDEYGEYDILYGSNYSSQKGVYSKDSPIEKDWNWTLLSFYQGCIPHQSTVCKKPVLEKFPFHEEYRIASARIFYIETIIQNQLKYKYIPIPLSICDNSGVSNTNKKLLMDELDNYITLKYGSTFLLDLKNYDRLLKLIEGRSTFKLLEYTSGRPRTKKIFDWWSKFCLKLIKLIN